MTGEQHIFGLKGPAATHKTLHCQPSILHLIQYNSRQNMQN